MKFRALLLIVVVPISHPKVSPSALHKFEKAVTRAVETESDQEVLSPRLVRKDFSKGLSARMEEEMRLAWADYYQFRWGSVANRLIGRADPAALALKALVAKAQGETDLLEKMLIRLSRVSPNFDLSQGDFPPAFLAKYREIRRSGSRQPPLDLPKIGGWLMEENSLPAWSDRLVQVAAKLGWHRLLVIGLEPIGWNYRVVSLLVDGRRRDASKVFELQLEDLRSLTQAARIVVKGSNVLTPPAGMK